MLKRYIPAFAVAIFLVALLVGIENLTAQSFNSCVDQWRAQQGAQKPHDNSHLIRAVVGSQSVCTLRFINSHEGLFSALAAFIVAGFTFALWNSTEKLWSEAQAARKHARRDAFASLMSAKAVRRSAKVAEAQLKLSVRPVISFEPVELVDGAALNVAHIQFGIRNSGNGPALDTRIGATIQTSMPRALTLTQKKDLIQSGSLHTKEINSVIERGEPILDNRLDSALLDAETMRKIRAGQVDCIVNFAVVCKDISDGRCEQTASFIFRADMGQFVRNTLFTEDK